MFGEDLLADFIRFVKAFLTNQYARFAPRRYVELTEQTGRGSGEETPNEIAGYFRACFDDYFTRLGIANEGIDSFLAGRCALEYGPGDLPGVAFLMYAHGADKVYCVDRFPLMKWSEKNIAVVRCLFDGLPEILKDRAKASFNDYGEPSSGFKSDHIEYLVRPSGLSGLKGVVDLCYSRAVLEHVDDLVATFKDMDEALATEGVVIHKIDLRSHGLHRHNPLDFLTWPVLLWRLMYSQKGVPNRWRVNRYREVLAMTGLKVQRMEPTECLVQETVTEVQPHLAKPFRGVSDYDLSWTGFWLIASKG